MHIAVEAAREQREGASGEEPSILIDKFIKDAIEVDVDAIGDGDRVVIGGVMQHIEEAGIHSGDSSCVLPPHSLSTALIASIEERTRQLGIELGVVGLIRITSYNVCYTKLLRARAAIARHCRRGRGRGGGGRGRGLPEGGPAAV